MTLNFTLIANGILVIVILLYIYAIYLIFKIAVSDLNKKTKVILLFTDIFIPAFGPIIAGIYLNKKTNDLL